MGARGRLPRSGAEQQLLGNPGHRAQFQLMATDPPAIPAFWRDPPAKLSPDEKEAWTAIGGALYRYGSLTELDMPALEILVCQWVRRCRLEDQMRANPEDECEENSTGTRKLSADMNNLKKAEEVVIELFGKFGMTPAARIRAPSTVKGGQGSGNPFGGFQ